jgi:beta-fructofuranosidase
MVRGYKYEYMRHEVLVRSILFVFFCAFLKPNLFAQDTVANWGFNENAGNTTRESVGNSLFNIQSKWPVVEWVPGVIQSAMRTDGYTVWASGTLPQPLPITQIAITGWIALEVYPVNHSALWAQFDESANLGAWAGLDQYGRLKVEFGINGVLNSFVSNISLSHYIWNYLVVNIDAANGIITGYINAVKVIDQTFTPGNLHWSSSQPTLIGKYPKAELNGLYNTNTMNALIDQVTLYKVLLDPARISQYYLQNNPPAAPDMHTPDSRFAGDFHRPKYHAIPTSNWCNESHGLFYLNGQYHMFYQKNGNGGYIYEQNWGHLVSSNLRQWQEVQPALWPEPGWDNYGIWSGHEITDPQGNPLIVYTGVNGIKAAIGEASPVSTDFQIWKKNPLNPVIPGAPTTVANSDFRDTYVFNEAGTWYMIVGSGLLNPGVGCVFIYKSSDLLSWQYLGIMYQGNNTAYDSGVFWEMPIFRKFGNKYMLMVNKTPQTNSPARDLYWVGTFSNGVFTPDNPQAKNLEVVNWLLSPAVNFDVAGRLTAIGIIPDLLPSSEQYKNGWQNLFALPRVWQMQNDTLYQSPHPDLDADRGDSFVLSNINIQPGNTEFIKLSGFQAEITASILPGTASRFGFIVEKNEDGSEYTRIYYDIASHAFVFDASKSSTNGNTPRQILSGSLPLKAADPIEWHIYIDGSVIEVFINNKWAFAGRVYPTKNSSSRIDLFSEGGNASASLVKAWSRGDLSPYTVVNPPPTVAMDSFKIWPVPTQNLLNIQLPTGISGTGHINIYNMSGMLLQSSQQSVDPSNNMTSMYLSNGDGSYLPTGVYVIKMMINNKIFKENFMVVR